MKTLPRLFFFSILVSSFAASQASPAKSAKTEPRSSTHNSATINVREPSTEEINSFMHHMFGYDANVKWKVESVKASEVPGVTEVVVVFGDPPNQQRTPFYVAGDLQHAFIGQIIPFGADPFAPVRRKLAEQAKGPIRGNPNGGVTIVEFSDFQCPHCKRAFPILDKLISESPDAKLVFENFPLSSIHNWADRAANYGDCIGRSNPDQFWKFAQEVFDQQEQITDQNANDKLKSIAQDAGADGPAMATCADSAETKARVMQQTELGKSLDVSGTPTLFIAGRKIANVLDTPYEVLKEMVAFEAQEAKKPTK
ncbi:MAG: thioredoxin domain-containing protein [Acidobacteria bacterium]|nr:thioredoxin domain-containing protein [Acidobacteriota bacterium]